MESAFCAGKGVKAIPASLLNRGACLRTATSRENTCAFLCLRSLGETSCILVECPATFVPVRNVRNWHERSLEWDEASGINRAGSESAATDRSGNGKTTAQARKEAEIVEQTYFRWRKEYGGLQVDQAMRLKGLEQENGEREAEAFGV